MSAHDHDHESPAASPWSALGRTWRDRRDRGDGRDRRDRRGRTVVRALAVVGALLLAVAAVRLIADVANIDLPDWFDGGRSDPAPGGSVIYEGQEATTASESFLIDVGDGEATVAVQAKQDWDRRGWIINGDFQSTNGTSSVADPRDRDTPARLAVAVDYCAEGTISTTRRDDGGPVTAVRFEMGRLYVCETTLEHTTANDSAFKQDDTPNDFHGSFVSFVARAAETTAAASACPADELAEFRTDEYTSFVRERLAERFDVAAESVDVVVGRVAESDTETKRDLEAALESFANKRDPDDPSVTYEALTIQYLSGDGEAVIDSCYKDPGGRDLDDLDSLNAPDA
jgi:hypothetical protein